MFDRKSYRCFNKAPQTMWCSIDKVTEGKCYKESSSDRCGYHIQSLVTKKLPSVQSIIHNMKPKQTQGLEFEYSTSDSNTSYGRWLHIWWFSLLLHWSLSTITLLCPRAASLVTILPFRGKKPAKPSRVFLWRGGRRWRWGGWFCRPVFWML